MRFICGLMITTFVFGFCLSDANALLESRSINELTRGSHAVVIGTVIDKESQWSVDNMGIYTYVTIHIEQNLKNSSNKKLDRDETITVRVPGGVVGDMRMVVSDEPSFDLNEKVFLFLDIDTGLYPTISEDERLGDFVVHGYEMGKFKVQQDNTIEIKDRKEKIKGKMPIENFISDIEKIVSGSDKRPSYLDLETQK